MTFPVVSADFDHRLLSLQPLRGAIRFLGLPVFSADCDHREGHTISSHPEGVQDPRPRYRTDISPKSWHPFGVRFVSSHFRWSPRTPTTGYFLAPLGVRPN